MTLRAVLILSASMAFAISPFLNPEFGGFDPERYPIPQRNPPVQPAGYAFAIWGVIYIWLIVSAGLGLWQHRDDPNWDATRLPLLGSLCVGIFWLPVALVSPVWASVMIWVMLGGAVIAMLRASAAHPRWALMLPLGLYAGWLSAASFVSIGLLGAGYGVLFAEIGWAVTALALALGFALAVQAFAPRVWTYGLAAGWGFAAIGVANLGKEPVLAALAGVAALLILGFAGLQLRR
ncbi:MAG: TspO/MBR family protein [Pseudomonadota bacterium]